MNIYLYIYEYMYIYIRIYIHLNMNIFIWIYIYIMNIYIYLKKYTYIYIHTYTHAIAISHPDTLAQKSRGGHCGRGGRGGMGTRRQRPRHRGIHRYLRCWNWMKVNQCWSVHTWSLSKLNKSSPPYVFLMLWNFAIRLVNKTDRHCLT
jgi:hypothetical protein